MHRKTGPTPRPSQHIENTSHDNTMIIMPNTALHALHAPPSPKNAGKLARTGMCPPNSPGTCLLQHRFRAIIVPNHVYTPAGPGSCLARFLLLPCGVRPVQGEEKDRKGRKGSAGGIIPPAPPRFALRLRRAADAVQKTKSRSSRRQEKSRVTPWPQVPAGAFRTAISVQACALRPPAVADRCPRFAGTSVLLEGISRFLRESLVQGSGKPSLSAGSRFVTLRRAVAGRAQPFFNARAGRRGSEKPFLNALGPRAAFERPGRWS